MSLVCKYVSFGLMFVFLGILGVGVFLFYIIKSTLKGDEGNDG